MNKEDRNRYVLLFPNWIARFVKNLHLTPQGSLQKPGKGIDLYGMELLNQHGIPNVLI